MDRMNGKKAAAIKYLKGDKAPFLLARGRGHLADRLTALALENGIPFVEDPEFLDELLILEPGAYLPPELFEVAARILSFVYAQDNSTDS